MHRYYYKKNAISEEDCDNFLKSCETKQFSTGGVIMPVDDNKEEIQENTLMRKAKIHALNAEHLFARVIWSYILEFNNHFKLSLNGYEAPQITKYDEIDDHYCWHKDVDHADNKPIHRKLSAILQLSKSTDYKGSELKLFSGPLGEEDLPIGEQGDIIVFRSEEWHKVTPLIEGTRYSLIMWATGNRIV
tara:strand:+ start:635 stop:1201 length:567 start_codon:yes stop_codon:yes gene_type:complete